MLSYHRQRPEGCIPIRILLFHPRYNKILFPDHMPARVNMMKIYFAGLSVPAHLSWRPDPFPVKHPVSYDGISRKISMKFRRLLLPALNKILPLSFPFNILPNLLNNYPLPTSDHRLINKRISSYTVRFDLPCTAIPVPA